jgi:predicted esterase
MRIAWLGFAACALVACGSDDSASTSAGPGTSTTAAGGNAGAAGTSTGGAAGSSTSSSGGSGGTGGGTAGSSGGGTAGSGTAGTAGTAGSGGTAGAGGSGGSGVDGGSPDASMGDSGMPKSDAITPDGPSKSRQTARPINMPYAKNGYWEYLPPGYGDGTKRPLLVFWHGVGEDGSGSASDLNKVLAHGPPKLINLNQWPSDRPYVVLSPQHGPADCPGADEIHDFIAFGMGRYDVDPNRIYLTGLSCGALGSSSYLGKYQGQQVVAAALIAGNASTAYNAAGCSLLNSVALWAFHGDADQTVLIGPDKMGMDNFKACPGAHKDALFDVIAGADHQRSWEVVYDLTAMKDIYTWMLAQHK